MKKYTFICEKHKKTARSAFGAICPICRQEMKCIGDRKRIGHCGQFNKIERKTKNLLGRKEVISERLRKQKYKLMMDRWKKGIFPVRPEK